MNKYLQDLSIALQQVDPQYYTWQALNGTNEEYSQSSENNFTSEIIRHLRNLIINPQNEEFYRGLQLHFDVRKTRTNIQPDIVLHESPNNQNRQILYCEVKTNRNANLTTDLDKLFLAISNDLNYKNAVIIVINKNLNQTILQIKNYIESRYRSEEDLRKLYLFHATSNISFESRCFFDISNHYSEI